MAKKVSINLSENKKEHRMNAPKTIVKQTMSKDIDLRRGGDTPPPAGAPGRKVGEETRIEITPERIRVRAYEIYLARNGGPGDAESDWCQAERELNGQSSSKCAGGEPGCDQPTLEIKTRTQSPCNAEAAGAGTGRRGGL